MPWISVLGRCVPGIGCLKLVCGCLLRHCLPFRFCRSGRFGRYLPARKDFPARALRVLCGCAAESTGAGKFVGAENWGYIRPVADGESPFCVRPVTGSHLFGSSIGRVLGLRQLPLPFRHLSWTILGDLRFSCLLCGARCWPERTCLCWTRLKRPRWLRTHCRARL